MTALNTLMRTVIGTVAFLSLVHITPALADKSVVWEGSEPAPGIWFYWYEPSFYAGFAPKTQDPSRVHMQLSRGNQQRFTVYTGLYLREQFNYLTMPGSICELKRGITLRIFMRYIRSLI